MADQRFSATARRVDKMGDLETMARVANIFSELSGAVALATFDRFGAVLKALDTLESAINWGLMNVNDPYRRQYAVGVAASNSAYWANSELNNPRGSFAQFSDDAVEVAQTLLNAGALVGSGTDLVQGAQTVKQVFSEADSITTNVSLKGASAAKLRSAAFTAVAGLAVSGAVDAVSNIAESQAKQMALGKGLFSICLPFLNKMRDIQRSLDASELGPMGILHLQSLSQTVYQLKAAALYGIAEGQRKLSNKQYLGPAYDAFLGTDDLADNFEETAREFENLVYYTSASTGRTFHRGVALYQESLNQAEIGDQTILTQP
jgi:hypothetical protein